MAERSLAELDWRMLTQRRRHPSPAAWEDQVLYFLMLDRFSDGREDGTRDLAAAVATVARRPSPWLRQHRRRGRRAWRGGRALVRWNAGRAGASSATCSGWA